MVPSIAGDDGGFPNPPPTKVEHSQSNTPRVCARDDTSTSAWRISGDDTKTKRFQRRHRVASCLLEIEVITVI